MSPLTKETEDKMRELLGATPTAAALDSISVRKANNFAGEPSLFVRLIFKRELDESGFSDINRATLDLVSWLGEHDHPEYPYIELSTVEDEEKAREEEAEEQKTWKQRAQREN